MPVILRKEVFCLHHWNHSDFVNSSHSKWPLIESMNLLCRHNGIIATFSKTGFLDMVPLCCPDN